MQHGHPHFAAPGRAPPPLLLIGVLLLWGWRNEFLALALLLGMALEITWLLRWRWQVEQQHFNRICNLSWLLLLLALLHQLNGYGSLGILHWLHLLPLLLFPVLLTQCYSEQGRIRLSALFFSLRRLERKCPERDYGSIDLRYPYLLICLFTAFPSPQYSSLFFLFYSLIAASVLWPLRSQNYTRRLWLVVFTATVLLGWGVQGGLFVLRDTLQPILISLADNLIWRNRDPHLARTALGSIAHFKRSERILLRVAPSQAPPPTLLREASYNRYLYGNWQAVQKEFEVLDPQSTAAGKVWLLQDKEPSEATRVLDISMRFKKDQAVVPVPHGILQVRGQKLIELTRNAYNALMLEIRPGWVSYRTLDQPAQVLGSKPGATELFVDRHHQLVLQPLVEELDLARLAPAQAIVAVKKHFQKFRYRVRRRNFTGARSKLEDFLYHDRSGHCEYFATATALLLRQADIPTRYALGYVIREYSQLEGLYVARARHAHSWVLAYLDQTWQVVDTTPPEWWPIEQHDSVLQSMLDFLSMVSYRLSIGTPHKESEIIDRLLYWLLVPLCAFLAWSLLRRPRVYPGAPALAGAPPQPGEDSEFYQVIKQMERIAPKRTAAQTLRHWMRECSRHYPGTEQGILQTLLALHYRYRFDPDGLAPDRRIQLRHLSLDWLKRFPDPNSLPAAVKKHPPAG